VRPRQCGHMPDLPGGDRVSMLDGAMLCGACLRVVSDEAAEMADALDMGFAVYYRTPPESGGDCGPLQVLGRYSIAGADLRLAREVTVAAFRGL
jgi:hypothetical protein